MRQRIGYIACFLSLWALFAVWGCGESPRAPGPPASGSTSPGRPAPGSTSVTTYDKDGFLVRDVERPTNPPNLVLILIDTLRADAIALPGSRVETRMPYLSELAGQGVSFANTTAAAPWTLPSLTSIVTGVMPHEHRVSVAEAAPSLNGRFTTAAEALRNGYGYEALAFAAGPWFDHRNSIWQGFRAQSGGFVMQGADVLLKSWIREMDHSQPFFLLLHTFEAHDPYGAVNHPWPKNRDMRPSPDYDPSRVIDPARRTFDFLTDVARRRALQRTFGRGYVHDVMRYMHAGFRENPDLEMAAKLADAYWDGVRWVDGLVKQTVEYLREKGLLDDTLLVITSDHGEAFGEHGTLEHGRQLYDELVRVPLVMIDFRKDPAKQRFRGGRVFRGSTASIDILPTFFAYAGMRQLDGIQGRPFLDRVTADERAQGEPVFSEEVLAHSNTAIEGMDAILTSVRTDRWKFILTWDRASGEITEELFDLSADPGEQDNLLVLGTKNGLGLGAFGPAVEAVRDRLWGPVPGAPRPACNPYANAERMVAVPRPEPLR